MQRLPKTNEPALGDDFPRLQPATDRLVSGHVSDQPIEEQHLGFGAEASARRVLPKRLASQAQAHAGDGGTRGKTGA